MGRYNGNPSSSGGTGSSVITWVSGMNVDQWQEVRSPADGEKYVRKTAAGGGTTDPADDVTNYNASSYQRVTAINPRETIVGNATNNPNDWCRGATKAAIPAIASGARTSVLSLTGRGLLQFMGVWAPSVYAGSALIEVFIDGKSVFSQSKSFSSVGGWIGLGNTVAQTVGGNYFEDYSVQPSGSGIPFRRSVQIFVTPAASGWSTTGQVAHLFRSEA